MRTTALHVILVLYETPLVEQCAHCPCMVVISKRTWFYTVHTKIRIPIERKSQQQHQYFLPTLFILAPSRVASYLNMVVHAAAILRYWNNEECTVKG